MTSAQYAASVCTCFAVKPPFNPKPLNTALEIVRFSLFTMAPPVSAAPPVNVIEEI